MKQDPDISTALPIWARTTIALCLMLLICPGLCWVIKQPSVASLIQGLAIPAVLLLFYFAFFGARLWVGFLLLAPLVLIAPAEAGFIAVYGHPSDYDIVGLAVESGPRETRDFLGALLWPLIGTFIFSTAVAILAPIFLWRCRTRWRGESRTYSLVIAVVLPTTLFVFGFLHFPGSMSQRLASAMIDLGAYAESIIPGYPFGVPFRAYSYYHELMSLRVETAKLKDFRFGATAPPPIGVRQIYIMVIGESSRRDHWSLFGYSRSTNPDLAKIANLVPIPEMITPWTTSRLAIPILLTRKPATNSQLHFNEPSILRVYSEAGFRTYWFSNQLTIGQHDFSISATAYEAANVRFFNPASWADPGTYDEVLIPALQRAIAESSDNLFVVLHTIGSHGRYVFRYPAKFDAFQPSQTAGAGAPYNQLLLNSYDNSILYTDHILAKVIEVLTSTGTVAALFYSSDHGEDIPNSSCSLSGHGNPSLSNFIVPALFWYSDQYKSLFPDKVGLFRKNAGLPLTTENVFETLVDLAGINLPSHDASKSLFSSELKVRPRLVNTFGQVDFDHAELSKRCQVVLPPGTQ
jgi:glucan phosphoethanolaminetransferase (alkaline phosphatase superfamily)